MHGALNCHKMQTPDQAHVSFTLWCPRNRRYQRAETIIAACQDALNTLTANTTNCAPTQENPQPFCTEQCRGYYDAVIDNCDAIVS